MVQSHLKDTQVENEEVFQHLDINKNGGGCGGEGGVCGVGWCGGGWCGGEWCGGEWCGVV